MAMGIGSLKPEPDELVARSGIGRKNDGKKIGKPSQLFFQMLSHSKHY
jgi:hypothetical protein